MSEQMDFPKNWKDFLKGYMFKDEQQVYTNGSCLVPVFRVEQMMEHYLKQTKIKNDWIPVSERLPDAENLRVKSLEECTEYLIQRRCGVMDVAMYIKIYGEAYFSANGIRIKDVIAWQPLPEPWKGE